MFHGCKKAFKNIFKKRKKRKNVKFKKKTSVNVEYKLTLMSTMFTPMPNT